MSKTKRKENEVEFLESIVEGLLRIDSKEQNIRTITGIVLMVLNRIEGRLSVIGDK